MIMSRRKQNANRRQPMLTIIACLLAAVVASAIAFAFVSILCDD